jgi:uncharacterized membrane protein
MMWVPSMRFRNAPDLILIALWTITAVFVGLIGIENTIIRLVFTLPLVFFFPGYAIVSALYSRRRLSDTARFLFSSALSISITALGGLVLHFASVKLTPDSWLLLLSFVTLAATVLAFARRGRRTVPVGFSVGLGLSQLLLLGLALVFFVVALGIAREGALQQDIPHFTQLWILPPQDEAQPAIEVGIRNQESRTVSYRLVANYGADVLGVWEQIELAAGEQWLTSIAVPPVLNSNEPIVANLYRLEEPDEVYRSVLLRLPD